MTAISISTWIDKARGYAQVIVARTLEWMGRLPQWGPPQVVEPPISEAEQSAQDEDWEKAEAEDSEFPGNEFVSGELSRKYMLQTAKAICEAQAREWVHWQNQLDPEVRRNHRVDDAFPIHTFARRSDTVWMNSQQVDMRFGLPSFARVAFDREEYVEDGDNESCRMVSFKLLRLHAFPPGYWPSAPGWAYELSEVLCWKKDKAGLRYYFTIDRVGLIHPAFTLKREEVPMVSRIKGRRSSVTYTRHRVVLEQFVKEPGNKFELRNVVAIICSAWKTREFHWMVMVSDGKTKVTFSILPHVARNIFAKRDKDGPRRKAILHWVRAHQRVGSKGVTTFLRGNRTFTMEGMNFELIVPGRHMPSMNNTTMWEGEPLGWATHDADAHRAVGDERLRLVTKEKYDELVEAPSDDHWEVAKVGPNYYESAGVFPKRSREILRVRA